MKALLAGVLGRGARNKQSEMTSNIDKDIENDLKEAMEKNIPWMFFYHKNDKCICRYFDTAENMILQAIVDSKTLGICPKDITFCKIVSYDGELLLHDLREDMSNAFKDYLPHNSTFCKK